MEEKYPPTEVIQNLVNSGFVKKFKAQRLPNNRINIIYRICDEYVIFIWLPYLDVSKRIFEISETYDKFNSITQNILTYENDEIFPNISIIREKLEIYKVI